MGCIFGIIEGYRLSSNNYHNTLNRLILHPIFEQQIFFDFLVPTIIYNIN